MNQDGYNEAISMGGEYAVTRLNRRLREEQANLEAEIARFEHPKDLHQGSTDTQIGTMALRSECFYFVKNT